MVVIRVYVMNDHILIILQPPSDRSQQFQDYCIKNNYSKEEFTSYLEFLQYILSRLFHFTKNDGLCCLLFPKTLTSNNELIYAHIVSSGTLNHTWGLNDEIILMDEKKKSLGKIAILKKGDMVETISRAERLTYISIPAEEKEYISESVWVIDPLKGDLMDEKVVRWLILSYSYPMEEIHDPFPEFTNSKKICLTLGRFFLESINT